jgi:acyl-CoA synthetase (AMP-forming)/AMP-acid ligase II
MVAPMPSTLVELLRERAASHRGVRAYTFLDDSLAETATLTFDELDERARAIAALLQSRHAAGSGSRA